jgi:hypothetical protein
MDDEMGRRLDAMMRRINDNHEAVLLELRAMRSSLAVVEADTRHVKADHAALRAFIAARAGETETMILRAFDTLYARLDQTERSLEERVRRLEDGTGKPPA